ncbi:tetratricopeptide (TPR) repeat protein [Azospirillum lipoferum]|uniref:Tetratricopeptide repeat protein n=1 Tax=Azospirillum lipoferum TaxID=193 RepID=A0A5A9GGX6_AZOLI|nr:MULTISPECIES: tetratricopeptide repeat protein [Azospirillum]KAA0593681.1 tetratricopeptide repeat protein [Azospirillum lipoferum]MCP1615059.1 tetratricopeptide (TPR) repeat protein [Azospirillum lipoferum]MDW5536964.1 tetratricopeptide repeat protein [Azospirillum sp. NL1]
MATVAEALQIAVGLQRADRLDEARAVYLRILDVDPRNAHALHLLGLIERRQNRRDKALELIRAALGIAPEMADASCNLGSTLSELGRVDDAAAAFRRAIQLDPSLEGAHLALASLLGGRGGPRDWATAAVAYRRVLRLNPYRSESYHDLGIALRQDGAVEEAQASQRKALALNPGFASAYAKLGNIQLELGDPAGALVCFRRSLVIDPRQGDTLYNQGNAQHAAGLADVAVDSYVGAARAGLTMALTRLADVLTGLGRQAEAEQVLRLALTSPGSDVPAAIDMLSALLAQQGRHEEARRFFADYRYPHAADPNAYRIDCLTAVAENWLAAGELDRAVEVLAGVHGHGSRFFTVKSIAGLQQSLARQGRRLERPANTDPSKPRICSSTLATHGRFAHNVLEYVLLRLYAEKFGYRLETPDWVGGYYFDIDDPRPSGGLKPMHFARRILNDLVTGRRDDPRPGVDILSPLFLFEHREEWRERVQSWLRPRPEWLPHVDPVMQALKRRGNTVVALHIRRGDFVWFRYTITETSWYVDWLKALWPTLDRPVLYIATDDPATIGDFAAFSPLSLADLAKDGSAEPWRGLEFLQDFHVLMNADVLGVSAQSGYSQLAALLNRNARLFVEPDAAAQRIRPYSPWTASSKTP